MTRYTARFSLCAGAIATFAAALDWMLSADETFGGLCRRSGDHMNRFWIGRTVDGRLQTYDLLLGPDLRERLEAEFLRTEDLWSAGIDLGLTASSSPVFRVDVQFYEGARAVQGRVCLTGWTISNLHGELSVEDFLAGFLGRNAVDYAEIGSNIDEMRTALEEAIGGAGVPERIVAGASRLRGYSWFVGFHSRLLDGAGASVSAIESSGAFESVRLLDNGVLLLRAAES